MLIETSSKSIGVAVLVACLSAHAAEKCPPAVAAAVQKGYPDSKITSCKKEKEHGATQYEVRLSTKESKTLELDISPEGSVLQTEEKVEMSGVPSAVTSAFEAKYPSSKATKAEKQTKADGTITYELSFKTHGKKHAATFAEDGKFQGEE
jgi:hypothetical protein